MDFVAQNWFLFVALVVVVVLLALDPIRKRAGGIRSISAIEAPQIINHEAALVVDVSENGEFNSGHVPGAINVPLKELDAIPKKLEKHKDKPVIVICRTGNRSNRAVGMLKKQGFESLFILKGGFLAWQKENYPIEK